MVKLGGEKKGHPCGNLTKPDFRECKAVHYFQAINGLDKTKRGGWCSIGDPGELPTLLEGI